MRGTWTFSFARQRGHAVHDEAACAEYPLPQLSHLNMSFFFSYPYKPIAAATTLGPRR